MLKKLQLLLLALFFVAPPAFSATYQVDTAHSQIHFSIQHMVVFKVRGTFTDFTATVDVDPANRTLTAATATINAASIDTRNDKRDEHLRSPDFFNVTQFPELSFVSKSVSGSGDNITVVGDLTIHGVTREVVLRGAFIGSTVDPMGNNRAGFEATGEINRKDFGLTWNKALETGGVLVGETVVIGLEIAAVEQK